MKLLPRNNLIDGVFNPYKDYTNAISMNILFNFFYAKQKINRAALLSKINMCFQGRGKIHSWALIIYDNCHELYITFLIVY